MLWWRDNEEWSVHRRALGADDFVCE